MLHAFAILLVEGIITAEMLAPVLVPVAIFLAFICLLPESKGRPQ